MIEQKDDQTVKDASQASQEAKENPMRRIRIEKITLNMGTGEPGPKLDKAKKILAKISGGKVIVTKTKKRTTFGGGKGRPIGAKVTLRGKPAEELLKTLLQAVDNMLKPSQFDTNGNFSFGVAEYISIPGIKYDPEIGIVGMDICVTLERPGFRIKKKRIKPRKVGKKHRLTKEEAIKWSEQSLGIRVTDEEE
jgi:large subunit ribosomal protein L5